MGGGPECPGTPEAGGRGQQYKLLSVVTPALCHQPSLNLRGVGTEPQNGKMVSSATALWQVNGIISKALDSPKGQRGVESSELWGLWGS